MIKVLIAILNNKLYSRTIIGVLSTIVVLLGALIFLYEKNATLSDQQITVIKSAKQNEIKEINKPDLKDKIKNDLVKIKEFFVKVNELETDEVDYKTAQLQEIKTSIETLEKENSATDISETINKIEEVRNKLTQLVVELNKRQQENLKAWEAAQITNTIEAYENFIKSRPTSRYTPYAQTNLNKLKVADIELAATENQNAQLLAEKEEEKAALEKQKLELEKMAKEARQLEQAVTIDYGNGVSYTGTVNSKNEPHGKGFYTYQNSNVYNGEWQNGLYHGTGNYKFSTGLTFVGLWENGVRHGEGVLTWKNGDSFRAFWQNGVPQGKAIWQTKNHLSIVMQFVDGKNIGDLSKEAYENRIKELKNSHAKGLLTTTQLRAHNFLERYNMALKAQLEKNKEWIAPDIPPNLIHHARYPLGTLTISEMDKIETALKEHFFKTKLYFQFCKDSQVRDEHGYTTADLGGYSVTTANLGVILDNSGSMQRYLDKLRKTINKKFKNSSYVEVGGCNLNVSDLEPNDENSKFNTFIAIKYLVEVKGVDTIFWYSDLNDGESDEALKALEEYFKLNFITFYLTSIDKKPSEKLVKLVESTGGKILKP